VGDKASANKGENSNKVVLGIIRRHWTPPAVPLARHVNWIEIVRQLCEWWTGVAGAASTVRHYSQDR